MSNGVQPFKLISRDGVSISELMRLGKTVEQITRMTTAGRIGFSRDATGYKIIDYRLDGFWAKITGAPTGTSYPWQQVFWDGSAWQDDDVGTSGTAAVNPAIEINGSTTVAANTIVWLEFDRGGERFHFDAGIGTTAYSSTTHSYTNSTTTYTGGTWTYTNATVNFSGTTSVTVASTATWIFNAHVAFNAYYCHDVYRASTAADLNNETLHDEPWWIITPTASGVELTGIDSTDADDGCLLWITNGSQTQLLTIPNESGSSTLTNTFLCPEGKDIVLGYDESVPVMRDDTDSRWRVLDQIPSAYVRDVTIYSGAWIFQSSSSITFQVGPKFQKPICESITEKAVTGTENDLDLGGPTPRYMLTPTGSTTITGIDSSGYSDGDVIKLQNTSGSQEIEITNEDSGSSADNRIRTPGASTYEIPAYGGVELMCRDSSGTKRWYVVADEHAAGGGSGAPTGAQYVTLATDATLTNERVLTGTLHQITVTDGGAGTTVTLSTPQDLATTSDVSFAKVGIGKTPGQGLDIADSEDIGFGTVTGSKIGTSTTQKIGFFGVAPVVQPTALTSSFTAITYTSPSSTDLAIQALTQTSPYGFVTQDEGHSVLELLENLQTRVDEIETKLQQLGLLA